MCDRSYTDFFFLCQQSKTNLRVSNILQLIMATLLNKEIIYLNVQNLHVHTHTHTFFPHRLTQLSFISASTHCAIFYIHTNARM